jgi:hypothetical protein
VRLDERIPGVQQHETSPALQVLEDELHARDGRRLRDDGVQLRLTEPLAQDAVLAEAGAEDDLDVDSEGLAPGLGRLPLEVLVEVRGTAVLGAEQENQDVLGHGISLRLEPERGDKVVPNGKSWRSDRHAGGKPRPGR